MSLFGNMSLFGKVKLRITSGRVLYFAAAALFCMPAVASADEVFKLTGTVAVSGSALKSFDISWVDPYIHAYFLADRSNSAVDVVDTRTHTMVAQFTGGFAGFTGNNDTSGPNGVLTLYNKDSKTVEVWAGNGPTADPSCPSTTPTCSTVKVFAYPSGTLLHTIPTNGVRRADELCYDPVDHLIQIANDAEADVTGHFPYINFIPTEGPNAYKVVKQIQFPEATNGIEACQWNPRNGLIYLNIPEVNGSGNDTTDGNTVLIDPRNMEVVRRFDIPVSQCAGPQGMAIGPDNQILLGCNAIYPFDPNCNATTPCPTGTVQNAAIIDDRDGHIIKVLANEGGADEVWFNPGDGHYFLADGSHLPNEQLGIVDSLPAIQIDPSIVVGNAGGTTRRAHSVAADLSTNEIYLPIPSTSGGGTPAFNSTLCGTAAAQGCIAVFESSGDDHPVLGLR